MLRLPDSEAARAAEMREFIANQRAGLAAPACVSVTLPTGEARVWMQPIPVTLRDNAARALAERNVIGFLITAGNERSVELVYYNREPLAVLSILEDAVREALAATRTNNCQWPSSWLLELLDSCDREKLRGAGDPLPTGEVLRVYRGIAGDGALRRPRGISWTLDRERAAWFATRIPSLPQPAVLEAKIAREHVYYYTDGRKESEVVLNPRRLREVRMRPRLELAEAQARFNRNAATVVTSKGEGEA